MWDSRVLGSQIQLIFGLNKDPATVSQFSGEHILQRQAELADNGAGARVVL